MAQITRYPFVRHLRSTSTHWTGLLRNGTLVREGTGAAFWFRPLSAALSEVPVDDRDLPLFFHVLTRDFQDITVQATVTYRVTDPALAAGRVDFSIDPVTGQWLTTPLDRINALLTESAQQYATSVLAGVDLTTALTQGLAPIRDALTAGLSADPRLGDTGLAVIGVRVVALRPEADVERALQTPTREAVQQAADGATYERRAMAVERERAIGENEMTTKVELARREAELVDQEGRNARRVAEEQAAAQSITVAAETDAYRERAEAEAERTRLMGVAAGEAEAAKLAAYAGMDQGVLVALALQELAQNLPSIEHLVLTPDLLAPLLTRLGVGAAGSGVDAA